MKVRRPFPTVVNGQTFLTQTHCDSAKGILRTHIITAASMTILYTTTSVYMSSCSLSTTYPFINDCRRLFTGSTATFHYFHNTAIRIYVYRPAPLLIRSHLFASLIMMRDNFTATGCRCDATCTAPHQSSEGSPREHGGYRGGIYKIRLENYP